MQRGFQSSAEGNLKLSKLSKTVSVLNLVNWKFYNSSYILLFICYYYILIYYIVCILHKLPYYNKSASFLPQKKKVSDKCDNNDMNK